MKKSTGNAVLLLSIIIILSLAVIGLQQALEISQTAPANQPEPLSNQPIPTPRYLEASEVEALTTSNLLDFTTPVNMDVLDPSKLRTVVTTGDIIPARGVDVKIRQLGAEYPFQGNGIATLLSSADLTIANLEAPLLEGCPEHREGFKFCGQDEFAASMASVGIDIATLENNHIENYGINGVAETIKHLESSKIRPVRSTKLTTMDVKGLTFGVLAFNGVGRSFDQAIMTSEIQQYKNTVDVLIVAFHWGKEYELIPKADSGVAPDDPRMIGRLAIESGADLIIGNHPHWVQGAEIYQDKLISYALGNFIFDQSWSQETQQGLVGTFTFYDTVLIKVEFTPIIIKNQAQPEVVTGESAEIILNRYKQSTQAIANFGN